MEYKTRYAFKISMDSNCSGRKAKENKVLEKGRGENNEQNCKISQNVQLECQICSIFSRLSNKPYLYRKNKKKTLLNG